jgi:hypothetical protein
MNNILTKIIAAAAFGFFCSDTFSQNITISGTIKNEYGEDIQNAAVAVYDSVNSIISHTFSAKNGYYSLSFVYTDNMILNITHIGYKKITVKIADIKTANEYITANFTVEGTNELPEIVIRPKNAEPDTVNLNLNKYNLKDDDKLAEILKRNPNFNVDNEGIISYKGKNIDKILLNGKDFFIHQNSIALDKIENKMISQLQIINNYKNSFSLDNELSDETVLNINSSERLKKIITGSISGGYGFDDKFDIEGSAFNFSQKLNSFLINNTNNIGKSTIKLRELQNLFSNRQPFSTFQSESVKELFSLEDRKKNMTSNTNLTMRAQNKRYRVNTVLYFFHNDRENDTYINYTDKHGYSILENNQTYLYRSNSLFNKIAFDWKLSDNQILNYSFDASMLNPESSSTVNVIYDTFDINTLSINRKKGHSLYNRLTYSNKISTALLFSVNAETYHERIRIFDSVTDKDRLANLYFENYSYSQNFYSLDASLKYTFSDYTLGFLSGKSAVVNESLIYPRDNSKFNVETGFASVRKIFDRISYRLKTGIELYSVSYKQFKNNVFFVPVMFDFNYENRLNRWYLSLSSSQHSYPVESGVDIMKNKHVMLYGNENYPTDNSKILEAKTGYSYNDIFQGKKYGMYFSFQNIRNHLKNGFYNIDKYGISYYSLHTVPNTYEYKLSFDIARLVFKYSTFPIKAEAVADYVQSYSTVYSNSIPYNVTAYQPEAKMRLTSISSKTVNFETLLRYSHLSTLFNNNRFISDIFNIHAIIKFDYRRIFAYVAFKYNKDYIIAKTYDKQNIDFNMTYKLKKITLSVESKNIDCFFHLFDNKSYNTGYTANSGINQITVNNVDINYLIFKIKYNY